MTDAPALELDGVVRTFGDLTAVDGVSFSVDRGQIVGLLGHNGAGKTTLIRLVNGLLQPHAGSIRTLGYDPSSHGPEVRRRTGVLTEYPALDPFLSPTENLAAYAAIHGLHRREAATRIDLLLARLGLDQHAHAPAHSLSAGLKQRVALARALVHNPDLLLLDEPTSNLDPMAARDVRRLIAELAREHGRTVLISTHNLTEAQELCDRIAIIRNGQLLAVGVLQELGQLVRRSIVTVTVQADDFDLALAIGVEHGVVDRSAPGDARLSIQLPDESIPALVSALTSAGVRVHAVVPHAASLEDVYVSLHDGVAMAVSR